METRKQLTPADIRACAAGLRDGMGGHADYCADIMDQLAKNLAAAEQAQPRCACGDSFTADAMCANCIAAAQPPAVDEGCGACVDGCQGQGCRLERESPPITCPTCNGHGMIGGPSYRQPDEGGEPCPDCTPATEYSWSENGEEYHGRFSSVAEAVCDYLDTHGDDAEEAVHIGEVKPHEPGKPIWLADNVLETLGEQAHGDVGEWVGDWPELPPEKREQLGKMIQDFVWTHDVPRFFTIGKSELIEVAAYRDDAAVQEGGA